MKYCFPLRPRPLAEVGVVSSRGSVCCSCCISTSDFGFFIELRERGERGGNGLNKVYTTHSCKAVKECGSEGVKGRTSSPSPAVVVVVAAEIISSVVLSSSPHDVATERERERERKPNINLLHNTVEPPNNGTFGTRHLLLYLYGEVVLSA